ncbi:hypothetical protein MKW94_004959 [Papaver nudicaule]|uniref:Uncharacterized protein n=1 Tax=Papaver nudicaule TaxID=74823 RepID=A0AA42AV82_PAPNU|nr:hypothetical protein [Papaver nudicaule]
MEGKRLKIEIRDAISKIRFAPKSNNLLISSWDSNLRLYDVDTSKLRSETPLEVGLLGCCFQDESIAFSIDTDCCLRRKHHYVTIKGQMIWLRSCLGHLMYKTYAVTRHDLNSGIHEAVGNHDDLANCVEYSEELVSQAITGGLNKRITSWDMRMEKPMVYSGLVGGEIESISLRGYNLAVGIGTSVNLHDLRDLRKPPEIQSSMEYPVSCVDLFPNFKGYAVGSVDGHVAVKCLDSNANEMSCMFRCPPKSRDGKRHLVAVNDIAFDPSHYGTFVTGDNEGYALMWDAQSRKRLFQFVKYPNSVASLSCNNNGPFLAVASSYTYQESNEKLPPQIFIHEMDEKVMDMGSMPRGTKAAVKGCY